MVRFSQSTHKALSSVFTNFSAVFLGSFLVPILSGSVDSGGLLSLLFGIELATLSVVFAVYFAEKGKL